MQAAAKNFAPSSVDVLAVADRRRRVLEQPLEQRFALDERHARQIPAVEMQQIEGDEHDLGPRARQRVLQALKARDAVRVVDDGFAVDERRAARQRARRRRDGFEALGPIVAAARQHRGVAVLDCGTARDSRRASARRASRRRRAARVTGVASCGDGLAGKCAAPRAVDVGSDPAQRARRLRRCARRRNVRARRQVSHRAA